MRKHSISTQQPNNFKTDLVEGLADGDANRRLSAALAIGTNPEQDLLEVIVARCAVEQDFYVRDMLTWALTRFPAEIVVPRLITELKSETAQARSQALHTLSKIGDASAWPAITQSLMRNADDEVARSAWRAAVVLVPETQKQDLAEELARQMGRGNREMQFSLSSALVALGEDAVVPVLKSAMASKDPAIRAHAQATEKLLQDPDAGFQLAMNHVKKILAPGG
ncbi:MAG: HEAT repeat domain-containing protein [Pseudomonadaceae bacterium]|nr:HEAT repeat domain-containing protein [Pseudomonadaceae bacterium]